MFPFNHSSESSSTPAHTRREAERHLAREVQLLLEQYTDKDNLHWQGSVNDLMEVLHIAFTSCLITGADGQYLSFAAIVARACSLLHVRAPRNPYERASRASQRQGFRSRPYIDRYTQLLDRTDQPLWLQVMKTYSNDVG